MPSLALMCRQWVSTVSLEMPRSRPIWVYLRPCQMPRSTCISRCVMQHLADCHPVHIIPTPSRCCG